MPVSQFPLYCLPRDCSRFRSGAGWADSRCVCVDSCGALCAWIVLVPCVRDSSACLCVWIVPVPCVVFHGGNTLDCRHFPHYLAGQECAVSVPMHGTTVRLWRSVPSSAIRLGWYKLILNLESNASVLFDLEHDEQEANNLGEALQFAAVKSDLEARLWAWLAATRAPIPWHINPHFRNCTAMAASSTSHTGDNQPKGMGPVADEIDELVDGSGAPCAIHLVKCHTPRHHES